MGVKDNLKTKFTSYNELLGASGDQGSVDVEIKRIKEFKNHPFRVVDDERMAELVTSIKENGVLTPIIVRPLDGGMYELISGHRRRRAASKAGLNVVPAIIREMTDEEATIAMVDANIQREEILPSEKAWAYRMKLEACKKQGARSDLRETTSGQIVQKLNDRGTSGQFVQKLNAYDDVSEGTTDGDRQIRRYIRLTELTRDLLDMVDSKKLPKSLAIEISYLPEKVHEWIYEYLQEEGPIKMAQIKALRAHLAEKGSVSQYMMLEIFGKKARVKAPRSVSIPQEKIGRYIPSDYTNEQCEALIVDLLKKWAEEREKEG